MERVLIIGMHDTIGGVETFLMNYYRNIDKEKIQFDFINMFDKLCFEDEILTLGGKIYKVPSVKTKPLKYYKEIRRIIKENEYKIVHVNMLSMANILPIVAAKKEKVARIILHSHNTSTPHGFLRKILNAVNKNYAIKHATDLVACSEYAGKWMFEEQRNFTVIKNAIDLKKYEYNRNAREKIRKDLNISSNYVIGHVGRFAEQKNHKFLIEIFNEVAKREDNARLLLIGEGDLKESIKQYVENLNLTSKVIFLEPVNNVNDYYQAMDIFVLPSLFEGLPVVGVEAQSSGLKCIFSKKITQELQITDRITFLDIDNAKTWADAIIREKEEYDRELKNGEIEKSGYNITAEAIKLQEFYSKVEKPIEKE